MVDQVAARLYTLGHYVGAMTRHQQQVARLYTVGEAHEGHRVEDERSRHAATDDVWWCPHVPEGGQREAPVGHWAPEVRAGQVISELLSLHRLHCLPPQSHHCCHDRQDLRAPTNEQLTDTDVGRRTSNLSLPGSYISPKSRTYTRQP